MGLVQFVLGQITNDFAIKVAKHSIPAVMAAEPIAPLPNEQVQDRKNQNFIYHSPIQKYIGYDSPEQQSDSDNEI